LLTVLVALTAVFCVLPALRGPIGLAVVAVAISSPLSFMVTTPQQHQLLALAPAGGQALITSLYQSAAYLAVSLSGAVGGVELTWFGPGWLAPIAAAFTATAAVITWTGTRRPSDRLAKRRR
jgi:DHA1 family inner membrane transport protein